MTEPRLGPGAFWLVNGLCSLIASLLIFRITGSAVGWAVLFLPGSAMVLIGLAKEMKEWRR